MTTDQVDNTTSSGPASSNASGGKLRRLSAQEIDGRIEECRAMLAIGCTKAQVKAAMRSKYGVNANGCEKYISQARAILRQETQIDLQTHRAEAYHFYKSIVANESAPLKDRINAQSKIDRLLGTRAPEKMAQTDAAGNDIPHRADDALASLTDDQLDRLVKKLAAGESEGDDSDGRE